MKTELERYIEEFSMSEDPLLEQLDRVTNQRVIQPKMLSGRVQGAFLKLITRILNPQNVLEIGTFTGYSALSIASGLAEGAELHTVEIDDELEDHARQFFEKSPHGHKIHLHIGPALDVVPQLARHLGRPFDLVFIDGDKREYPDYYRMLMGRSAAGEKITPPLVGSGSVILADNVLWYGKVTDGSSDRHTAGIVEFNRLVAEDPHTENVILPVRDGINLIRVL